MNRKLGLAAIIAAVAVAGGYYAYSRLAGGTTPAGYACLSRQTATVAASIQRLECFNGG